MPIASTPITQEFGIRKYSAMGFCAARSTNETTIPHCHAWRLMRRYIADFAPGVSLRATNLAQTIWNERLMQESNINRVTMAAAWENNAGPSNRARTTLKTKFRADTNID